jgi:hypothetical protein
VVPGNGRQLACLFAHGDRLSGRCDHALYDASAQLDRIVGRMVYLASECEDELQTLCAEIRLGDGRVLDCLQKRSSELSPRCGDAVAELRAR